MSQLTRDVPSRSASSLHRMCIVCTSLRGGSTTRFSPSASRPSFPGCVSSYREPVVHSEAMRAPKWYFARISGSVMACHSRSGVRPDIDLEDLFHGLLQFRFQAGKAGGPGLGVLADPAVVQEPDRNRVQVVDLLPAAATAHHQAGLLEQSQVLRDGDPRHVMRSCQRHQCLAVLVEERVEKRSPSRVGKCPEHRLHGSEYRKPSGFLSMVSSGYFHPGAVG